MSLSSSITDRALSQLALFAMRSSAHGISRIARAHAHSHAELADLTFETEHAYGPEPEHRFELVRLRSETQPLPMLLYFHGGGFQQMSRHTHWWFAAQLARAGYSVLNLDYRLAPRHPYPAAAEDALRAYHYAIEHGSRLSGDPRRIFVAGDSAGANLAFGLACDPNLTPRPSGVALFSGFLQVSYPRRLWAHRATSRIVRARIESITREYARMEPGVMPVHPHLTLDPLLWLEAHPEALESLPPVYASCGTADPVLSDTLRLRALLAPFSEKHHAEIYDREPHVFQGMPWRKNARVSLAACVEHLRRATSA